MELFDKAEPESTAKYATAEQAAEQAAEQVDSFDAVVARYIGLLSGVQEANRDWERIFDAIEDPICVVTADYRLIRANAAYTRLFGSTYELGGRHYCFTPQTDDADDAKDADQADRSIPCADCPLPYSVRTRRAGYTQQHWLTSSSPDGAPEARTYQRWTYPIVNADGAVDRVVEVVKDVTEQERIRRSVVKTEALRETDRLKAELLGTVSHELRSPLTAIKGYAATLLRHERRLPREERHEFLTAIGEASDRLEVIINRLLQMSQLETGSIVPHLAPVDVAQVAREAIALAVQRTQASTTSTTSTTNTTNTYVFDLRLLDGYADAARTFPVIDADARLMRDVLDNLLENAVKYSPEGGKIDITIGVRSAASVPDGPAASEVAAVAGHTAQATPQQMLEIIVRDRGVGIPAEHLGRVFERFHRVDTRLKREVTGLGLGLAMCKRIAELHGGAIWVESAPSGGSAFHLVLPVVTASVTDWVAVSSAR